MVEIHPSLRNHPETLLNKKQQEMLMESIKDCLKINQTIVIKINMGELYAS